MLQKLTRIMDLRSKITSAMMLLNYMQGRAVIYLSLLMFETEPN